MSVIGKTILIVDDEQDLIQLLSWDFQDQGMKVLTAYGGIEAFKILESNKVDFLLSDMQMVSGDGMELLKQIHISNIDLKAIYMMTGNPNFDEEEMKGYGMTELLKKPIDTRKILKKFIDKISE